MRSFLAGLLAVLAPACAGTAVPRPGLPAVAMTAAGETEPVGSANLDAADDPAIWRNPSDPAGSLIVATDKKAGLHVYGLDGRSRFFEPAGEVNNVDLVDMGAAGVIVVASDRNDRLAAMLRLYRLDASAARLVPLGIVGGGAGEAYGVCLRRADGGLHAYSVLKSGAVHEYRIDLSGAVPAATLLSTRKLATQTEGCVVDPRDGTLYVGEEDVGIWRFPAGSTDGTLVAPVDGRQLVADVEGLALLPQGERGGYLVASSQGDFTYAVYRLPGMEPAGRFRIARGRLGGAEETDGIELATGDFGPLYPGGLFVAQDGMNDGKAQNFKLVAWDAIRSALGL